MGVWSMGIGAGTGAGAVMRRGARARIRVRRIRGATLARNNRLGGLTCKRIRTKVRQSFWGRFGSMSDLGAAHDHDDSNTCKPEAIIGGVYPPGNISKSRGPGVVKGTVTILIPTYARSGLLRGAIRCALGQTRPPDRVIVLDDASPDDTGSVVDEFASDGRVEYVRNEENLGLAQNWAKGIGMVETDFFCILNDDDRLAPVFLETLVGPLLENSDLVTSSSDHWMVSESGERLHKLTEATTRHWKRRGLGAGMIGDYHRAAVRDQSLFVGATVFRRGAVAGGWIDRQAQGAADLWVFYRCAGTGRTGYFTPERLLDYRVHAGGMTRDRGRRIYFYEGYRFVCGAIASDPAFGRFRRVFAERRYRAALSLAAAYLASGRCRDARAVLGEQWGEEAGLGIIPLWGLAMAGPLGASTVRVAQGWRERMETRWLRSEVTGGDVPAGRRQGGR